MDLEVGGELDGLDGGDVLGIEHGQGQAAAATLQGQDVMLAGGLGGQLGQQGGLDLDAVDVDVSEAEVLGDGGGQVAVGDAAAFQRGLDEADALVGLQQDDSLQLPLAELARIYQGLFQAVDGGPSALIG
ncbi:MAG: hypothetical protein GF399_02450 [Candidatus Coatesbacteria bacterium]|nr:hypothetical protein [Candidatus Coatesbacteria bacterium]